MADPGWYDEGRPHLWLPYTQMKTAVPPLAVAATNGVTLTLADGRTLVDGIASWWTAAHGYNHPHIIEAVKAQYDVMPHVMFGGLVHEPAARLATRLAKLLPGDLTKVFFAESGSVSVEVAMKMALQYHLNRGERRPKFVHFRKGYHGDTFATMAVCDPEEGMHAKFAGMLANHLIADLPRTKAEAERFADWLKAEAHQVAAVITEPLVQGAGGMVFHGGETLRWLREACDAAGGLLILDEIFTGFGRTGAMFACEAAGIVPDIVTLSKALTGGVCPLSATIATARVYEAFHSDEGGHALMHGPTYMAHAAACAAANASLDLFEQHDRLSQARAIGAQLKVELEPCRALAGVKDVRVLGAIGVVELEAGHNLEALKPKFVAEGVWIRPFGNIVYLTPALTIGADDLSKLTGAIFRVLSA
ncbi:adenosylmethionine--8-amino-7-oxononanoate transaminase [Pseudokordiimonas caeni]|uniref:adenosylmethionine--8-amino-7-oxononanoate transaminase n=1 Tax=Pseudokordiimonas caeni TaxID=2997908 RepID=UPI002810DBD6|nr:adenosylmethionine--8-amino-7-oxononanoate transaminase [Pseudokordiimonas caeni]